MNKQKRSGRNSKGKVPRKIRGSSNVDDGNKNKNRTHQHATSRKKNIFDTAKNNIEDVCETSKKKSKIESRSVGKKGNSKRKTKPKKKKDGHFHRNSQIPEENDGRQERKLHNKKPERKEKANRSTTVDTNKKVTNLKQVKQRKSPNYMIREKGKKRPRRQSTD